MNFKLNFSIRQLFFPLLSCVLIGYFSYHVFQGERGIIALLRIKKHVKQLETERDMLQETKIKLERNAYLLRPDSLDTDLLEERARAVLHYATPTEVVILNDHVGRKAAA